MTCLSMRSAAVIALVWMVLPVQAEAQGAAAPRKPMDLSLGVVFIAPASLGSVEANLLDGSGNPFLLFRADNDTGPGLGFEATIGSPVGKRFDIEFTGAWTRFDVRSTVSDDFEDVPDVTLEDTLTRFSVEGAVLWRFAEGARAGWFLRGGAGWMRELSSDSALAEDGVVANAGIGVKYWMRTNAAGEGRLGLRAEFRVLARTGGIEIDERSVSVWPAASGALVVRF